MKSATDPLIMQLKALADPVRLRLVALCRHGECSVSELTEVLGLSQPRASQHLKILCEAGLLERFRDGHFVFYRVARRGPHAATRRRLLGLLPADEPAFDSDLIRLRSLRSAVSDGAPANEDRALYRALVELSVTAPLGDLLDIGCGHGGILKLLASRARRAVGVDIDADARRFARAELLLAGLPHCTLRRGDMVSLPFPDEEFDTVILDDVLVGASDPAAAVAEALRLLRPGGRLFLLASTGAATADDIATKLAVWSRASGLRLSPPRAVPADEPRWILAVATRAKSTSAAA